jgi:transcriptional regulator with XRE-family HTH domain
MQAVSVITPDRVYDLAMSGGRPPKSSRSAFGQRLYNARQQMGYSQTHMAELLGVTQPSYAAWERCTTALRPEHLSKLATVLNVSVDYLLGHGKELQRGAGPVGKTRRVFEQVSGLSRSQQQHIVRVVEDLIAAQRLQRPKAA